MAVGKPTNPGGHTLKLFECSAAEHVPRMHEDVAFGQGAKVALERVRVSDGHDAHRQS